MTIKNKKIFIFGGSGSLGNCLVQRYIENNSIIVYSRDEMKHWGMALDYNNHKNLSFIIGDIREYNRVETSLLRENPDIVIIASALKHIDRCEYATSECINTNISGIQNVVNVIEKNQNNLSNIKQVCFVSTDKACSPVNVYGMCKAISENLMIEKAYYVKNIKWVTVRYGNVLNSNGSIIPILHRIGKDSNKPEFQLTHKDMTRFVMTLEQSVDLIEHAITFAESGDIVIPELTSMKVSDLFQIFSELYNKPIKISGLRPGEKLMESLINDTQSLRLVKNNNYYYIKPSYHNKLFSSEQMDYNSSINPIGLDELEKYLKNLNLL